MERHAHAQRTDFSPVFITQCALGFDSRSQRLWRVKACDIHSGYRSHQQVLPSMSVNKKVTVPEGRVIKNFLPVQGQWLVQWSGHFPPLRGSQIEHHSTWNG